MGGLVLELGAVLVGQGLAEVGVLVVHAGALLWASWSGSVRRPGHQAGGPYWATGVAPTPTRRAACIGAVGGGAGSGRSSWVRVAMTRVRAMARVASRVRPLPDQHGSQSVTGRSVLGGRIELHGDLLSSGGTARLQRSLCEAGSVVVVAGRWRPGGSPVAGQVLGAFGPVQGAGWWYAPGMRFQVLGPLEVDADGGPVALGGRRSACCWPCC